MPHLCDSGIGTQEAFPKLALYPTGMTFETQTMTTHTQSVRWRCWKYLSRVSREGEHSQSGDSVRMDLLHKTRRAENL